MKGYNKIIIIALVSVVIIGRIHLSLFPQEEYKAKESNAVQSMHSTENKSLSELAKEILDELGYETEAEE